MSSQDWYVLIAAASFFLLGIVISPLAWLVRYRQRSEREEEIDRRLEHHSRELKALHSRCDKLEGLIQKQATSINGAGTAHAAASPRARRDSAAMVPRNQPFAEAAGTAAMHPPTLIAIPKLASTAQDSDNTLDTLSERYAAVWNLADSGSSPDGIARATGQPIGQVELILGLRRQLASPRTGKPHTPKI